MFKQQLRFNGMETTSRPRLFVCSFGLEVLGN